MLCDNGFLNLFLLNGEPSLLENQVAIELFRRFGHDTEHDTVYFYNSGIEVDFYVPEKEWAIQVSYSISDVDTLKREVTALEKITKVLPCSRRTIITYDTEETITDKVGEIEVVPCWKWMIEDWN
ncbi:MAG: ATP-binding protein [Bacteroidales bacterium]|nr:ATP-binding protein [Bacteroidales bacterium]